MLKNKHILILGGDARYLEIIDHLAQLNAKVYPVGFDKLTFDHPQIQPTPIEKVDFSIFDGVILPVLGTSKAGEITPPYSEKAIHLEKEMIQKTPSHCVIFTGTANDFLRELQAETKRRFIILFERDDVAILNSIPTAEATLQLAIEHTDETIHGSKVMTLGFGRVGITVAKLFANVGAHVSVIARKPADLARITEIGLTPKELNDLTAEDISAIDIFINTVPDLIVTEEMISQMKKSSLIIDLASKPGGTDFTAAEQHNIKALHALGLPGKTAPKTAGQVLAKTITRILLEKE